MLIWKMVYVNSAKKLLVDTETNQKPKRDSKNVINSLKKKKSLSSNFAPSVLAPLKLAFEKVHSFLAHSHIGNKNGPTGFTY